MYDFKEFCNTSNFEKYVYVTTKEERLDFNEHLIVNIEFTQISFSPFMPMILFRSQDNFMQINGVREVLVEDIEDSCVLTFVCQYGESMNKKSYTFKAYKKFVM